ncbi:dephospho-CoA kinase [uncultured Thermanaerothrix sp.]|uniref:dephospho-CoA kinase n=1 Tax=uncultured Thermanaerothrix sp. TaxID=1195149 RepID=UPI00262F9A97|nr:dephospho-CoA kinase [uncultured Thermanaerothrix sp.]
MSQWSGKYVIGLTGNIATGKSVVRRMLEHLGAYGIDADALAHRAIARGAPGYQPVVELFGRYILGPDGEIDRRRLGKIVFSDPVALASLERIVHPLVSQAIDFLVRRVSQPVVVIEAIKLVEANLHYACDSLWVVYAPVEVQLARLMRNRGLSEAEARQRIAAQPPQEQKMALADVIIRNAGSFEETWKQVVVAWRRLVPVAEAGPLATEAVSADQMTLEVVRGRPRDAAQIAALINRLRPANPPLTADDIMAAFGEKAFLLLRAGKTLQGVMGWQVENLVARTTDILLEPGLPLKSALVRLIQEMERASKDLQCEASLIFVAPELARQDLIWHELGYTPTLPERLEALAWQEAARESMPPGTVLLFKKLRQERILRPI